MHLIALRETTMFVDLSPTAFLEKVQEVAKDFTKENPLEVPALRHIVPVFVEEENGMRMCQAVVTHLTFKLGEYEYRTREEVIFNKYGEANLRELKVWETIVTNRSIPNVQPIRSTRTGAF